MIDWYLLFMLGLVLLWFTATNKDRSAVRIVALATLASALLVAHLTNGIDAPWELFFPGAVETITIACLLTWARNRTGYWQAACLTVAWLAHVLCYVDLRTGGDVVYTHYERILAGVALAQLAGFHDTLSHNLRGMVAWCVAAFRYHRGGAFRAASVPHPLLRAPRLPKL